MTLDEIILARRSVRQFSDRPLDSFTVSQIIAAGTAAPAVNKVNVDHGRQFVAVESQEVKDELYRLAAEHMADLAEACRPGLDDLKSVFLAGPSVPCVGIDQAPWIVVVAEPFGRVPLPGMELAGLGHTLQNMWLKATSLGVGMHLVTLFSSFPARPARAAKVFELLGIRPGSAMNACALGWPHPDAPPGPAHDNNQIFWL